MWPTIHLLVDILLWWSSFLCCGGAGLGGSGRVHGDGQSATASPHRPPADHPYHCSTPLLYPLVSMHTLQRLVGQPLHWSTTPHTYTITITHTHTHLQAEVREEATHICWRRRPCSRQMDAEGKRLQPLAGILEGKTRQKTRRGRGLEAVEAVGAEGRREGGAARVQWPVLTTLRSYIFIQQWSRSRILAHSSWKAPIWNTCSWSRSRGTWSTDSATLVLYGCIFWGFCFVYRFVCKWKLSGRNIEMELSAGKCAKCNQTGKLWFTVL